MAASVLLVVLACGVDCPFNAPASPPSPQQKGITNINARLMNSFIVRGLLQRIDLGVRCRRKRSGASCAEIGYQDTSISYAFTNLSISVRS